MSRTKKEGRKTANKKSETSSPPSHTDDKNCKTWSIRGVSHEAISTATHLAAKEDKFIGQWITEVILRERTKLSSKKTQIARPSDVDFIEIVKRIDERLSVMESSQQTHKRTIFEKWREYLLRGKE